MNPALSQTLGQTLGWLRRLPSTVWLAEVALRGAKIDGAVEFLGRPIVSIQVGSVMVFGGDNRIFSSPRCNPLGLAQPCVLRTLNAGARLEIGKGVGISGAALCAGRLIEIGANTIIGAGAMIIDNDFHAQSPDGVWVDDSHDTARPVRIGRSCFIGARAIVLKGVTIGHRAKIGAGAVVTKDVPEDAIAVGNPARIIAIAPAADERRDLRVP